MIARWFKRFSVETPMARRHGVMWGAVVFLLPFLLHYNYILNAFYHYGAPYFDAGLFANLLWHNDWRLMNPYPRGDFSYFGVHFTPFLLLVSRLSYFLPTHMVEFYAGFMACIYATLGLALFYILSRTARPRNQWQLALIALLGIAFAFNGAIAQGMWMPHFEYAVALGIMLFLFHFARGSLGWAIVFFIFTLSLREDAGFHLAAILGLLMLVRYYQERSWRAIKNEAIFTAVAIAYSVLAFHMLSAVNEMYNEKQRVLDFIYLGNPPFAHLTWGLIGERLGFFFKEKSYIWLSVLMLLGWSARTRNPWLAAGALAYIPWIIVNLLALNNNTGHLYAYYTFPFVVTLGWPALAVLWQKNPMAKSAVRDMLGVQIAVSLAALLLWSGSAMQLDVSILRGAQWGGYQLTQGVDNRDSILDFVQKLHADTNDLGTVMLDSTAAGVALTPAQDRKLVFLTPNRTADSIVYIGRMKGDMLEQVKKNRLTHYYCLPQTQVCLFSNRTQAQLGIFSSLLAAKPLPANVDLYLAR